MAIGDILYPLCKFDYDFMYLVLAIAPMIAVFLLAYNGIKLMSDNEETRSKGKHGIKNALLGVGLVIFFAAVGNMLVPECVPFPGTVYSFSLSAPAAQTPFNVWITSPNNADLFSVGSVSFNAHVESAYGAVCSWNFNDKGATTSWGSCMGVSHNYANPGDYIVVVSAREHNTGRIAVHRIIIRVQK